jgi:hypothetical protein
MLRRIMRLPIDGAANLPIMRGKVGGRRSEKAAA